MNFEFCILLRQHLADKKLTLRAFAKRVDRTAGFINDILQQRRDPPKDVTTWAIALGLTGEEKSRFILLAGLHRSPKVVVDHVLRQADEINALKAKLGMNNGKAK